MSPLGCVTHKMQATHREIAPLLITNLERLKGSNRIAKTCNEINSLRSLLEVGNSNLGREKRMGPKRPMRR